LAAAPGALAQISNLACAGSTDTSILCTWTTVAASDSKVTCGAFSTPVVDPVDTVTPADFYGVTNHRSAVTGLAASTTYSDCHVASKTKGGTTTTSGNVSATTLSQPSTTAFSVTTTTFLGHYYQLTGHTYPGDTRWCAWADDGTTNGAWVCNGNDFTGVDNCCGNSVGLSKWNVDNRTATMLGNPSGANNTGAGGAANFPTTYTSDGQRSFAEGVAAVRGNVYQYMWRSAGCGLIFKSADVFSTTVGPVRSLSGPGTAGVSFTPSGNYDYPTTSSGCTGNAGAVNGHYDIISGYTVGLCKDWGGLPSISGNTVTWPFACSHNAGTDGWVYMTAVSSTAATFGFVRVRVEDIQLNRDYSHYQRYIGSGGSDGLADSSWQPYTYNDSGTQWSNDQYGRKPHVDFIPGLNRWVATAWTYADPNNADQSNGFNVWDLGRYPWDFAHATLVKFVPYDPNDNGTPFNPVFPQIAIPKTINNGNGTYSIELQVTGSDQDKVNYPTTYYYQPAFYAMTFSGTTPGTHITGNSTVRGTARVQ